ncbi:MULTISPECIES: MBL fold metallo-hydrolase [unclassified Acinetobacter]|uniref:MBL fold metallo-hydrolase n=1 Tax=unclassified Acinetobacter TaxID=196816 RepID=UPI0035B78D33
MNQPFATCHFKDSKFYNTPPTQALKKDVFWKMLKIIFNADAYRPQHALPMQAPDWHMFFNQNKTAQCIWLGHSSLLIRMAKTTILIDPCFYQHASPLPIMMKRFQAPPIALADLPKIDYILISHNHYDHLDHQVIAFYQKKDCQFIVPLGLGKQLQAWGIDSHRIHELDWWQNHQHHNLNITAVPARHNSARGMFDRDCSLWAGFVLHTAQEKIYFSADSSYGEHFKQIGDYFNGFDLVLMENGQYNDSWPDNHMFPAQTIQAVQDCQAKVWMPIHWGAYALALHPWYEPVQQSMALAQQYQLHSVTPMMGQVFDKDSLTMLWWEDLIEA